MTAQSEHRNVITPDTRRLTFTGVGKAVLEKVVVPQPKSGEVIVETLYSAISRGTESLVFRGAVPTSEWERMRCPHMAGSFSFPVTYGYAVVGNVIALGAGVKTLSLGDRVFVLHPHQEHFVVSAEDSIALPKNHSPRRAVLAANMETALNAVWDSGVEYQGNATCVIIGAGSVGLLTAHALQHVTGSRAVVVDTDARKQDIVQRLGFEFQMPEQVQENGLGFDYLFHTSGSSTGLQWAIDNAAFEAIIIEMSWYGDKKASLELGGSFHSQRLKLISSQVGAVSSAKRETITHRERLQHAMMMTDCEMLDLLLEDAVSFSELPQKLPEILGNSSNALCQIISYAKE